MNIKKEQQIGLSDTMPSNNDSAFFWVWWKLILTKHANFTFVTDPGKKDQKIKEMKQIQKNSKVNKKIGQLLENTVWQQKIFFIHHIIRHLIFYCILVFADLFK